MVAGSHHFVVSIGELASGGELMPVTELGERAVSSSDLGEVGSSSDGEASPISGVTEL